MLPCIDFGIPCDVMHHRGIRRNWWKECSEKGRHIPTCKPYRSWGGLETCSVRWSMPSEDISNKALSSAFSAFFKLKWVSQLDFCSPISGTKKYQAFFRSVSQEHKQRAKHEGRHEKKKRRWNFANPRLPGCPVNYNFERWEKMRGTHPPQINKPTSQFHR